MLLKRGDNVATISNLTSRAILEAVGCMMFHFIGSITGTTLGNSISLMCIVYYVAHVTGAHLNPALSFVFTMLGYTTPFEMLVYWFSQIAGCIVGALFIAALVPQLRPGTDVLLNLPVTASAGCFQPAEGLAHRYVFAWEAIGTFLFLVPIFSVVWYTLHKQGYGTTGPIMVGLSLLASASTVAPWTGAALNPARVLGSPAVFDCGNVEYLWLYVLGELFGALFVPLAVIPWYGIAPNAWYMNVLPLSWRPPSQVDESAV